MVKKLSPKATADFAIRLKMARERKFESAKDFANFIGVEEETYRTYERAENEPNITTLCAIARGLNASLDHLILGEVPPVVTAQNPIREVV